MMDLDRKWEKRLVEQRLPGGSDESEDGRVLQSSLCSDGVEMLCESLQLSDQLDTVLAADLFLDHRHAGEDPMPVLSERLQCRTVVELTHNIRMQPMVDQPLVEQPPKRGIRCREE